MNVLQGAMVRLLPVRCLPLRFQLLSSWVFLHKKFNFTVPREWRRRHQKTATAKETMPVFLCRAVTQEDRYETLDRCPC